MAVDRYIDKKIDGRYIIKELIGIGGMANVYKAVDPVENRLVAVKILREEYLENEELLRRFRNESKAISVLSHPNIVRIFDVSLSDRMPSIVMEYIDGITLKDYIDQQNVLSWKEAVHFTVQILRALQHAHDNGIVHRDVKPQNIMLLADGTIKITDFGIARFARAQSRTITDRAIGSVHYISPEQARGEITDQQADIYSVGVLLYEMLTGQLPFEGESPVSVALKHIEAEPKAPRTINPTIPEGLEEITLRAMEKEKSQRYLSASEMLRDIDEFKKNPSISFEYNYMGDGGAAQSRAYDRAVAKTRSSEKSAKPKRAPIIASLLGMMAAFVLACGIFIGIMLYLNNPFRRVADVTLPNLVGQSYESVKGSKKYSDFHIQVQGTEYSADYERGVIIAQSPVSGRTVKVNSVVKVTVSGGPPVIAMPDLTDVEYNMAVEQLTKLGLEVGDTSVFSDTVSEGNVVRTDPARNTNIEAGSIVTLYVSRGSNQRMVTVPDFTNLSIEEAQRILGVQKLELGGVTVREDSTKMDGKIIAQDPAPGGQIPEGDMVNFVVSSGGLTVEGLILPVDLPRHINRLITIQAVQNGIVVQQEQLNPNEVGTWKPSFQGTDKADIGILIDGRLYKSFTLYFDDKTYTPREDNSMNF